MTGMTWEDYHKMEKPVIRIESKINFEVIEKGTKLALNPDMHGFTSPSRLKKALTKKLEFDRITANGMIKCYSETGIFVYYKPKQLLIL